MNKKEKKYTDAWQWATQYLKSMAGETKKEGCPIQIKLACDNLRTILKALTELHSIKLIITKE